MNRLLTFLFSITFATIAQAGPRYLGFYDSVITHVSSGQQSASSSSENYFVAPDESFVIQTIAETVSERRSRNIRSDNFWSGFATVANVLAETGATFSDVASNNSGAMTSFHYAVVTMDNIQQCLQEVHDNKSLAISIIYTNNSDHEISISYDGLTFYIQPYHSFYCDYVNRAEAFVRVQSDLADPRSATIYSISVSATCRRVRVDHENDSHIFCHYSDPSQPENLYCIYDKRTANCEYHRHIDFDALIREDKKR